MGGLREWSRGEEWGVGEGPEQRQVSRRHRGRAAGLSPSPCCVARAFLIARRMDVNVRRRSWSREEGKSGSREAGGEAGEIGEKDGGKEGGGGGPGQKGGGRTSVSNPS